MREEFTGECSPYWGVPAIKFGEGFKCEWVTNESKLEVFIFGVWRNFTLKPVGAMSRGGHGEPMEYSACCIELEDGTQLTGKLKFRQRSDWVEPEKVETKISSETCEESLAKVAEEISRALRDQIEDLESEIKKILNET